MTAPEIVAVFAKQPRPGAVKTRLCPPLTACQAARLYECSLRETVRGATAGDRHTVLYYQGERAFFEEAFPALPLYAQQGADLGARLVHAFASRFEAGARKVVVIGSDSPDLPQAYFQQAFAALDTHDTVLAPAADGGYVLIGLRRPAPELFTHIPWSTPRVLAATRQRIAEHRLTCVELSAWYDIDDVAALRQLMKRTPHSDTARLAARWLTETGHAPPSAE